MKITFLFLGLVLSFKPVVSVAQGDSKSENAKMLSDWIGLHLSLIRSTKGISQGQVTKQFLLSGIAFYECVASGNSKYRTLSGQLNQFDNIPKPSAATRHWSVIANSSYAAMLNKFFGGDLRSIGKIDSLEAVWNLKYIGRDNEGLTSSKSFGKKVAEFVLVWGSTDGSAAQNPPYELPKGDDKWTPTPPSFAPPAAPQMINFRESVKGSTNNTMPSPQFEFSSKQSSDFFKMAKEVFDKSVTLSQEEKAIALFWDDLPDGRYYGAVGHWSSILRQVLLSDNVGLEKGAEAFVRMVIAANDAQLACWKAKYNYNLLRPVTYINKYMGEKEWKPLIVTPNHPEYPAAHATVSMAAAHALTQVLGKSVSFVDHTYDDLGFEAREFRNFEAAAMEAGQSRLYGGIHFTPSIKAGYKVGEQVGENISRALRFALD